MQEDSTPDKPPYGTPCCALMTTGTRKKSRGRGKGSFTKDRPGRRMPCPAFATKYIDGKPYCTMHGPSKFRIDPFYDSKTWRDLRHKTLTRDEYICQYCGFTAHQADHVIPRGKGGADALTNLVACCRDCNKIAAGTTFDSFAAKKRWIIEARKKMYPNSVEKRPSDILSLLHKSQS